MGVAGEMAVDGPAGPLLVVPDRKEGQFFYRISVESTETTQLEARPFPCPAAHFPSQLGCGVFAVCGRHILGLSSRSRDTFIYDTAARTLAPGPQLRDPKSRLAVLPVGDDAALVMDLVLARTLWPGDTFASFEALRRVPGGDGWRAVPLPDPPVGRGPPHVTAYFALSARAWVSMRGEGTFSVDVREGAEWRAEERALP